jgi:hypothetical protein
MKPEVLVQGQEPELRSEPSHYRPAYGEQNKHAIDAENQSGASRNPHRVLQRVQTL